VLDFRGYGDRQTEDCAVYHRARPARAPSALRHEQVALVKHKDVERLERSDKKK